MTELELFEQSTPMIAEIILECRKLTSEEYLAFKNTTMKEAPETAKRFVKKLFVIIESELKGKTAHG